MPLPVPVGTLHLADKFVFGPVCLGLTLVRYCLPWRRPPGEFRPRKLVFVKLAEQGSTVLAVAAIQHAVSLVGRENTYFVAFEENRFILDVMDLIPSENVLTVRTQSLSTMIFDSLRAIRRMHRLDIDTAVDLEFLARFSAAITYLSGARWRSGMHGYFGEGPYRGDLMTHRVLYNAHIHTGEMFLCLVEALQLPAAQLPTFGRRVDLPGETTPTFTPSSEEREQWTARLCGMIHTSELPRIILLNPNAGDMIPLRRWPTENYAALAKRLLAAFPEVQVIMTGGPSETMSTLLLASGVGDPRCFSLAGRTTLRELLVLYTLSEVLVTNDSGPAHFATLTPIRVVTLFGPETPQLFAACTERNTPLWAGIACSPCVNALNNRQSACRNNLCMQALTVDQVFEATARAYRAKIQ